MSTVAPPGELVTVVEDGPSPASVRMEQFARVLGRWVGAIALALVFFSILIMTRGSNPITVFSDAWVNTIQSPFAMQQALVKAGPMILAALAVVVPARAGLVNVGGEGQLLIGAVAAAGVAQVSDGRLAGPVLIVLMALAGLIAGALWSGLAAFLRVTAQVNEAVGTLLLNFIALDLLLFLIFQPWKDPNGTGQPASPPLQADAHLPMFPGSTVNIGIIIAVVAAILTWALLRFTRWGFKLAVAGGNPEAARRAGMPVSSLLMSSMLLGGAFAGLGGMLYYAGTEFQLRPGIMASIGYTAFLASWLVRHRPLAVVVSATVLSILIVSGDSLQIDSDLPAATINILTGLLLIAVLGWTQMPWRKSKGSA
ncbi:MAG: ABC transporter permease [Candidatus Nanopelagicales bacterium]|nr:ABC transporter permease [Candidatus Nanopelagicales bacterium]